MNKNLRKLYYLFKYGGWDYVRVGMIKKVLGREKGDKAKEQLYIKIKQMKPEQYEAELTKIYALKTGEKLDLKNPQTFNEKIQWLKLYDKKIPLKTTLTDKYLVRDWIKEKIGEQYLIPLIGVWDKFDDINIDELPNQFVLKANHGSGWNVVVKDKSKVDWNKVREKFNKWLSLNYAFAVTGFQLQYLNIVPKIIAEQYIENENGNLYDYKIHCFNGKPEYIQMVGDRNLDEHCAKESFYNTEWVLQPFSYTNPRYETVKKKPPKLADMLKIASTLSAEFAYVRVDLYELDNGDIKFGEMTFTPVSGFDSWKPAEMINPHCRQ